MRRIATYFGSYARRIRQHISGYVLVDATQQTDQRTSQMVYLLELGKPRPMGGGKNSFA